MNLFTVWGTIGLKDEASKALEKVNTAVDKAGKKVDTMGSKMEKAGTKMGKVGKDLTKKVTVPLVALGTASFMMAADMEDALGAVENVFSTQHKAIEKWASEIPSYYGVAKNEALETSYLFGSMLQSIGGVNEKLAAEQSMMLTELAGDMAAMYGGSVSSASDALLSMLQGNTKALARYGVAISDVDRKNYLMSQGIDLSNRQMTSAEKQTANMALAIEQLGFAQGQALREADGASGSVRAFTTETKNLTIALGEVLLPIITPMIQKLVSVMEKFNELSDSTKKWIVIISGIAVVIGPLLSTISKVITAINVIGGALAKLGPIFSLVGKLGGVLITVLKALWAVMLANPITFVIAAIVALIAWFVHLYNTSEEFRAKVDMFIEALKESFANFITTLGEWASKAKDVIVGAFTAIGEFIVGAVKWYFDTLIGFWTGVFNFTVGILVSIKDAIVNGFTAAKDLAINVVNTMKTGVINTFTSIRDTAGQVFTAAKDKIMTPINAAKDGVKKAVDTIKSFFTNLSLKIPKPTLPSLPKFTIDGGFSFKPLSVPKLGVKWNADGGIFDEPTIFNTSKGLQGVGEAGPEAILPLEMLKNWVMDAITQGYQNVSSMMSNASEQLVNSVSGPKLQAAGDNITINITGDWTVDSDERQEEVIDDLTSTLLPRMRGRGIR